MKQRKRDYASVSYKGNAKRIIYNINFGKEIFLLLQSDLADLFGLPKKGRNFLEYFFNVSLLLAIEKIL